MTHSESVDASICRSHTAMPTYDMIKQIKLYFLTLDLMFLFNSMFGFGSACAIVYALNVHDKYKTVCHLVQFFSSLFSHFRTSIFVHAHALFGSAQLNFISIPLLNFLFFRFIYYDIIKYMYHVRTVTNAFYTYRKNKYRQILKHRVFILHTVHTQRFARNPFYRPFFMT